MTTTRELLDTIARIGTIGATTNELKPGDVLFDTALPYTGLGMIRSITHVGLVEIISMEMVVDDGSTASDDACDIYWHSTLPLGKVDGMTAAYFDAGYGVTYKTTRALCSSVAELGDAIAEVI